MKNVVKLILIAILTISIFLVLFQYFNSYKYYEKKMVNEAKKYIESKNIDVSKEIYININELSISPKKKCDITSGVIVDKNGKYNAYLSCSDYKSKIINKEQTNYSLEGSEILLLPINIKYIEKGLKNNANFQVYGQVEAKEGVYNLAYRINDGKGTLLTRKVIVVNSKEIEKLYPTISLIGDKEIVLDEGAIYIEKGAVATDEIDKNITNKISVTNNIDVNKIGDYEVIYTITNSSGYSNSTTRKVKIISKNSTTVLKLELNTSEPTNQDVIISLKIEGADHSYVKLPDQTTSEEKELTYKVSSNGVYNFVTYDKYNKTASFDIAVENIDKEPPNGSCNAQVYPTYTNISVTGSTNDIISEYSYIINGVATAFNKLNTYKYNKTSIKSIETDIKDNANNVARIKCNVKYIDPSMNNSNVTYYTAYNTEYVIPKTQNKLDDFIKTVSGRICQNAPGADKYDCGDKCNIVAQYYVYFWKYSTQMHTMSLQGACQYGFSRYISYNEIFKKELKDILKIIYDEINKGNPVIAKVTRAGVVSQHYVMVVGYKRGVYNSNDIKETDFLVVNPTSGTINCTDKKLKSSAYTFLAKSKGYEVRTIASLK